MSKINRIPKLPLENWPGTKTRFGFSSRFEISSEYKLTGNLLFILSILLVTFSCQPQSKETETATKTNGGMISKTELVQLKKERSDLVILDVRTVEEAANGIIPGAFNVDFYTGNFDQALATLNKKAPIVVYCQSGGRSGQTVEKLLNMGYTEVYDFQSYDRWLEDE